MKLLIDTNIILDVILKREPFYNDSLSILNLSKRNDVCEYISASAVTDIYYIAYRALKDHDIVKHLLHELFVVVNVAEVTELEIHNALESDWKDFEDAVQYSVAVSKEIDRIITRNPDDYSNSNIQVLTPAQALKTI
jgi:predicted nucleic acid-binding protein